MEIFDRPLTEIANAVRQKQIKSIDLVRGFLDRIEKVNGQLNAVVLSNAEHAIKLAEKADTDLEQGNLHGPLHGIPMTIKDSLDTGEMITTWGTMGRKDYRPGPDATCVARLRGAGGIILGKTNTPEFTLWFQTDNLVYGQTKNPYDLSRTPGGSSGGAAAIIAAGASIFDIGTDTGGSIRLPSHFSGIAGIKPTTGRVPCTGATHSTGTDGKICI
jgi:amidase